MKNALLQLFEQTGVSYKKEAFNKLSFTNDDDFFLSLNNLFNDPLIKYSINKNTPTKEDDLPEQFITLDDKPFFVRRQDFNLVSSSNKALDIESLLNQEIAFITERPKQKTSKDFLETLLSFYPKINFLLLLTVPFVLIPAFYANLFNTRMIFNDLIYTLVFVTAVFIGLWLIDYSAKYFIKKRSLTKLDEASQKVEKYFFHLTPFIRSTNLITKMKMIEGNKKILWENLSGVLVDITTFSVLTMVLFMILGPSTLILLAFYIAVIIFATYMRYRNYKLYIEVEAINQDLLVERLSYYKNNQQLSFLNMDPMQSHFSNIVKQSLSMDHDVNKFNFDWDEFVRFSSFAATFVLFAVIFMESKLDASVFNVLIALLILNSRTSASVISLVTKTFHMLISGYHIKIATNDIFENVDPQVFQSGFRLNSLDKISIKNLTVSVEGRRILNDVSISFRPNMIYALYGDIGVGKSTFIKCLVNIHQEYSGEILFNDSYSVRDIDNHFFSTKVAYMDPSSDFIKGSIFYNFEIRGFHDKEMIAAILNDIFPNYNIDYDFVFQQDATQIAMSTGQKRKLLLFMSLNKEKEMVILDEALINITYRDISVIIKHIKENMKHATVFIISHDKNILNLASDVYELKDQKISLVKTSVVKV